MEQVKYTAIFVLAFTAGIALLGALLSGRRSWQSGLVRALIGLPSLAAYIYGVLHETILNRTAGSARRAELELFWSHRESLALVDGDLIVTNTELLIEIILNVLLFVPLGALLPFLFPRQLRDTNIIAGSIIVCAVGCACSCAIELAQWRFSLGLFEFDDILNNTLGAFAGYLLYRVLTGLAERCFHRL